MRINHVASAIADGLIGGMLGVITLFIAVMILPPFLNWFLGHG